MSARRLRFLGAAGDLAGVPARLGVPGRLERAEFVQDRPGCAGLSAEAVLFADAGSLSRCAVRLRLDPAEPDLQHRHLGRNHHRHHADGGARRLRAGAAALPRQEVRRLLCTGDADAAAGRHHHPLLSGAAEHRLDRHLPGHHPDLSLVLAAFRDLAAGVLFRGHSLRDGGSRLSRRREPAAHAVAHHHPASERRHRRNRRLRVPQCVERVSVRRRTERQHGAAGHGRDVQLRLRGADAVGEARSGLGAGNAPGGRARRGGAEDISSRD